MGVIGSRWRRATIIALAVAVGGVVAPNMPAGVVRADSRDAKARVQAIADQLDRLAIQIDQLNEEYLGALDGQQQAEARLQAATADLASRQTEVAALRDGLSAVALQRFMEGGSGTDLTSVLMSSDGPTINVKREFYIARALAVGVDDTDQLDAAVTGLAVAERDLQRHQKEASSYAAQVDANRVKAQAQEATYMSLLADAEARYGQALAEEEARREAAAAARAQADYEAAIARQASAEATARTPSTPSEPTASAPPAPAATNTTAGPPRRGGGATLRATVTVATPATRAVATSPPPSAVTAAPVTAAPVTAAPVTAAPVTAAPIPSPPTAPATTSTTTTPTPPATRPPATPPATQPPRSTTTVARSTTTAPRPTTTVPRPPTTPKPPPTTPAPPPTPPPTVPKPPPPPPSPDPSPPPASSRGQIAVAAARTQLGVPYVFGAAQPGVAFDCSGITMWAWSRAGVSLPHQSRQQYAVIPHVRIENVQPGDLIFAHNPISHVGIYIGNGQMIHAPHTGSVVSTTTVRWANVVGVGRPG